MTYERSLTKSNVVEALQEATIVATCVTVFRERTTKDIMADRSKLLSAIDCAEFFRNNCKVFDQLTEF
uniref:Uncharacterized protein n=1 Tax=Caenorhabditis japonica TaxID=281687 RepID=A0A8R1E4G6_CAEJA